MSPGSFLKRAEDEAEELGHEIAWDTIGDSVANGRCPRCGGDLTVAVSRDGLGESRGVVLERHCHPMGAGIRG